MTEWKYAPTRENHEGFGNRGCTIVKLPQIWLKGTNCLCNTSEWPRQPYTGPASESQQKFKITS